MKTARVGALSLWIFIFGLFLGQGSAANHEKEFQRIGKMNLKALTTAAQAALDKKYPAENWEKYKFPKYVYINNSVVLGYKIAAVEPQLIAKFPCYCMCDDMGHKNLLHCFLEKGVAGGGFDDHAATCNICYSEAMRIFLWNEIGAAEAEMLKALKEIHK